MLGRGVPGAPGPAGKTEKCSRRSNSSGGPEPKVLGASGLSIPDPSAQQPARCTETGCAPQMTGQAAWTLLGVGCTRPPCGHWACARRTHPHLHWLCGQVSVSSSPGISLSVGAQA